MYSRFCSMSTVGLKISTMSLGMSWHFEIDVLHKFTWSWSKEESQLDVLSWELE